MVASAPLLAVSPRFRPTVKGRPLRGPIHLPLIVGLGRGRPGRLGPLGGCAGRETGGRRRWLACSWAIAGSDQAGTLRPRPLDGAKGGGPDR